MKNLKKIKFFFIKAPNSMQFSDSENINVSHAHLENIGSSGSYMNTREVCCRFRVVPGKYVIIPSTYDENQESDYLLRVFTEIKKKR